MSQPAGGRVRDAIFAVAGSVAGVFLVHHGLLGPLKDETRALGYLLGILVGAGAGVFFGSLISD